jgi:hypothetical protein
VRKDARETNKSHKIEYGEAERGGTGPVGKAPPSSTTRGEVRKQARDATKAHTIDYGETSPSQKDEPAKAKK